MDAGLVDVLGRRMLLMKEADPAVVARLQKKHPQLGLKFLPIPKEWWVVWYWDANDPRRQYYRDMGLESSKTAHSLLCPLPQDCAPEQAEYIVDRELRINPPQRDFDARIQVMDAANAQQEDAVMDVGLDDVKNRIELSATSLKAHFTEGVEATDLRPTEDVEHVTPEEIAAVGGPVP